MELVRLVILLGVIYSVDLLLAELLNVPFGKALPLSYIVCSFLMYLCSLLGRFSLFKYVFAILLVFTYGYTIFLLVSKKKSIKVLIKQLFRPSTLIFTFIFIYMYFMDRYNGLSEIDDFFRWAGKVKDGMVNDKLYDTYENSYVFADYYPPFTILLSILFNKFMGGLNEGWSMFAIGSFVISLAIPFLDKYQWKWTDCIKCVVSAVTIVVIYLTVSYDYEIYALPLVFNTTYVDWVISALLGYGFYLVFDFNNSISDYIGFGIVNSALMQTDRTSLVYVLLLVVTLLFRLLYLKEYSKQQNTYYLLFAVLLPVVLYLGWRIDVGHYNNQMFHQIIHSPINSFPVMSALLEKEPTEFHLRVFVNVIRAIIAKPIYYHPFKISFGCFLLLFGIIMGIIIHFHKGDKQLPILLVFYILGAIGHLSMLLFAYETTFSVYEAERLSSFFRYCACYSLPGIILIIGIILHYNHDIKSDILTLALLCLFIEPAGIDTIKIVEEGSIYRYQEKQAIENYVNTEYNGQKTLIINQWDQVYRNLIRYIYGAQWKNTIKDLRVEEDMTLDRFKEIISNYEYILIGDYDEYFENDFWTKITDVPVYNTSLYQVINEDGEIRIVLIYPWSAYFD